MNINWKSSKPKPVLLLFGPTAVGKTELLFRLQDFFSQKLNSSIEVISADSMQIYRGMNIGTAKPDAIELEKLPHWLIDIKNPDEIFDLGDFISETEILVEGIHKRSIFPVISGGTAYYFKHYLYGLPTTPEVTEDIRILVEDMSDHYSNSDLHRMLARVDQISAGRIHINDSYRIQRALEVYFSSGKPLSSYDMPDTLRNDIKPIIIGLKRDRQELYERINQRVIEMIDNGLVDEVRGLAGKGYMADSPGIRGIGYKEFFSTGAFSAEPKEEIIRLIQRNSRRYAKRQLTFFSSLPNVIWFHPENQRQILNFIESALC